jgi:uncharacterized membrane protein YccC
MAIRNPDRRSNLVLRALIEDMLERIRVLNRDSVRLTESERELAEADLESVMAQVRRIASHGPHGAAVKV